MEITAEAIVFLILSAITLGGGTAVVVTRNLFHAGLFLMVSLFGVAGLFLLLTAPFLAGAQVVIYIGAIAILIILAIMLTPSVTQIVRTHTAQWPYALAVAAIFFVIALLVVSPLAEELGADNFNANFTQDTADDVPANSMVRLGQLLVSRVYYMLPFEIASVLLMAALIGAVLLVWPESSDDDAPSDELAGLTSGPGEELSA